MDPLELLQALINNARKIVQFAIKPSIDTTTEAYFLAVQRVGSEVERINVADLPVSTAVTNIINNFTNNIAVSRKFQFTSGASQTTFNVPITFDNSSVWVDNVYQLEGVDYNVTGQNVIFVTPQLSGSRVDVRVFTSSDNEVTNKQNFTATAGQTVFISANTYNSVDVYVNEVYQIEGVDYNTASPNVTFTSGLTVGDLVTIRTYGDTAGGGGGVQQETGTFTPVLNSGATTPYTFTTTSANYIKTDNEVYFTLHLTSINGTGGGASSVFSISGLPFTCVHSNGVVIGRFSAFTGSSTASVLGAICGPNNTSISFSNLDTASALANVNFAGAGVIIISGTYITN